MIRLAYDFHIHSGLSPCADEDMTPANIVGMATIKGLDVIALTDHNSCKNCQAIMHWAKQYGVMVLPGMELTTLEEVHVLCLFSELEKAMAFDQYVYAHLNKCSNMPEIFGSQWIYNEKDEVEAVEERLLIQSTDIRFDQVYGLVNQYDGVMIPAHIDKKANSLLYNLGFVPETSKFRSIEISNREEQKKTIEAHRYLAECLVLYDSDAHYLTDISERKHYLEVPKKSRKEIIHVLRNT